ncbi:MAG TPA: monovalent cation/H+ antiporter complex subunit F [Euzebyales bacterium]|nr:monovalent cation/H+ antiporter complex subunit F [Euzebyales bacterium]
MTVVLGICLGMLAVAAGLTLLRIVRKGMTLADRMVALDLLLLIVVAGVAVGAVGSDSALFLDVVVVVSLLGFVGTVTVARFIERRGL